jgi:hypothetical protein
MKSPVNGDLNIESIETLGQEEISIQMKSPVNGDLC